MRSFSLFPHIESVGTSVPKTSYSQNEVLEYFDERNPKIIKIFKNSFIEKRHFTRSLTNDRHHQKNRAALTEEHLNGSIKLARDSVSNCLKGTNFDIKDIDQIVCVTSTGFLTPGLSAYIIRELGFRRNVKKVDIVGMGCNADMNGLQVATNFVSQGQNRLSLVICVEVCSATRFYDGNIYNAVANSLFADASATILVSSYEKGKIDQKPLLIDFESLSLVDYIDDMRFLEKDNALSFFLSKDIPYVIGKNIDLPISRILERNNLEKENIIHWVLHGGGKKVIDAVQEKMGLPDAALYDTRSILRRYGNVSSCSYIFAYESLLNRIGHFENNDHVMLIAMGPGTTIEVGLLSWQVRNHI
jgi:polyketide synthase Type III